MPTLLQLRDRKQCSKCGVEKALAEFHRKRGSVDGRQSSCIGCRRAWEADNKATISRASKAYYEKNHTSIAIKRKVWRRRTTLASHGLTAAQFDKMVIDQGNRCCICEREPRQNRGGRNGSLRWCIDHDHRTGQVRGLLCHGCNKALGFMADEPSSLLAAERYIQKHRSLKAIA
mgnify:CR=1 FL=1